MILLYLKIKRRPLIKGVPIKLAIESLVSHYNPPLSICILGRLRYYVVASWGCVATNLQFLVYVGKARNV